MKDSETPTFAQAMVNGLVRQKTGGEAKSPNCRCRPVPIGELIQSSIEKSLGPDGQAEHARQIAMIRSVGEAVANATNISCLAP